MRLLILLLVASSAYAERPPKPEPPMEPPEVTAEAAAVADAAAESSADASADAAADASASQSQTAVGGNSYNSLEWPRVSAVFGMGSPGATSAPVSNGPCPLYVQDKPNRSFPGVGRGATYKRDDECWELTQEWVAIQRALAEAALAQAQAEADLAAAARMRAACDDCLVK